MITRFEARRQAFLDGARYYIYQTYQKKDFEGGCYQWCDFPFYELEYYFTDDNVEVGYHSSPTNSYRKISRKWSPDLLEKMVEKTRLRMCVEKKSGKPFKGGAKIAIVVGDTINEHTGNPAYIVNCDCVYSTVEKRICEVV
jgi:hypothetical protein